MQGDVYIYIYMRIKHQLDYIASILIHRTMEIL